MTNPWLRPEVAQQQRALVDRQLAEKPWPAHFTALVDAVRATQCPGQVLIVGCGVGHEREILDRAGVEYRSVAGIDISGHAIALALERYPESQWTCDDFGERSGNSDVVVDSACLMHVENWRAHVAALCRASRRHVILHRVPLYPTPGTTSRTETYGYGQMFPAWRFAGGELVDEMKSHGFVPQMSYQVDDPQARTLTFAKPRHYATYCDAAYLPRLKALHASMVRHCGPFVLHCLAWDQGDDRKVSEWCAGNGIDVTTIGDFENRHRDLWIDMLPGPKRTRVEHMYTVGPAFIADVMKRTGEPCTYVDADLYAFSSPEPFFAEAGGAPAAFVGHNFAPASRGTPGPTMESHAGRFGSLNVGLCHFNERRVAEKWAELTRAWCYDRVEKIADGHLAPTVFADQTYLEWIVRAGDAIVIKNESAMVGPWNVNARSLDQRDGVPYFGNRPIGFYHFSALQLGPHGQWSPSRPEYRVSERAIDLIYGGYLRELDGRT